MAGGGTPQEIIRDALARALFDADQRIFDALKSTPFIGGARVADGAAELARRVVNELTHAGYEEEAPETDNVIKFDPKRFH